MRRSQCNPWPVLGQHTRADALADVLHLTDGAAVARGLLARAARGVLVAHLDREHQLAVSEATVRRALHELGYRWKRPRFVLSRRDPNWRQAKGGSRGD